MSGHIVAEKWYPPGLPGGERAATNPRRRVLPTPWLQDALAAKQERAGAACVNTNRGSDGPVAAQRMRELLGQEGPA